MVVPGIYVQEQRYNLNPLKIVNNLLPSIILEASFVKTNDIYLLFELSIL